MAAASDGHFLTAACRPSLVAVIVGVLVVVAPQVAAGERILGD